MTSRDIVSVTESAKEKGKNLELAEQPEYGNIFLNDQIKEVFPEDDLVSIQAAREYLALLWQQYQGASRKLKSQLLDEVTRNLGIHRSV